MRDTCTADDSWHGYRQKFRVFFREANMIKHKTASRAWKAYQAVGEEIVNGRK